VEVTLSELPKDNGEKIPTWGQGMNQITSDLSSNAGESCLWFELTDAGKLGGPAEVQPTRAGQVLFSLDRQYFRKDAPNIQGHTVCGISDWVKLLDSHYPLSLAQTPFPGWVQKRQELVSEECLPQDLQPGRHDFFFATQAEGRS
jgi:hypothetical protein